MDSYVVDAGYVMFYDEPFEGGKRFSFGKIINSEVQAMSIFGLEDPINGEICYNVGYAVSEFHRGRGLALEIINKGLEHLKNELNRTGLKRFYLEAVIDKNNIHSIKVAEKLFSIKGSPIIEGFTNTPAIHFARLIVI